MENNQNDDFDYAELTSYSFIAFHTYSLNMKEIQLLEYKIAPVYKQINEEDKKKNLNHYLQNLNIMILSKKNTTS